MLLLSNTVLGIFIAIIVIGLLLLACCIKIVPQAEAWVLEKLGSYHKTLTSGVHWVWPIFFRISKKISLKEQVRDYDPQPVITMDNVTMQIDTVVFYEITDPKLYTYGVENPIFALEKLTATTLRNIIGSIELDQTLTSRDLINTKMTEILDVATDPWGVKVNRVELQDIIPPTDIQTAMEKQMKAERDRRAAILEAEGLKKSAVLKAEGEKEAAINRAEGEKQANILKAEGIAQARILEADGEKEAIGRIINALADKGQPDKYLIAMKYLETMKSITSGQNNKVVYMPYEATGILSSVDGIKQMLDANK